MSVTDQPVVYLTPNNAKFVGTSGNMLEVTVDGKEHPSVFLHCSFPHTNRQLFISVRDPEHKEVGMIRSLGDFPESAVELLERHIQLRYFAPRITKVVSVKEEYGHTYWDTATTAGACRFTVKSGGSNVKMVTEETLLITDVDGNRFVISPLEGLSDKELRMVEMCI